MAEDIGLPETIEGPSGEECDRALGVYMRMWGQVETTVNILIHKLLDTDDVTTVQIIILSVGNMRAQLEFAIELGKHRLQPNDADNLEKILERIKNATTRRNNIVHGTWMLFLTMGTPPNPKPLVAKSGRWIRVYRPPHQEDMHELMTGKNQKLNHKYKFTPEQIMLDAETAHNLSKELNAFLVAVTLKPPRIPLPVEW
jgi:hypothetical protein